MNLAVSNIAWPAERDEELYAFLAAQGFGGLEIAPTRLFPEAPYEHRAEATAFAADLLARFGLCVCSMQSIWYGRTERLFGSAEERAILLDYTKKAILFAEALGCPNLVFGSPKNRVLPEESLRPLAVGFFREAGDFAAAHGAVVAMEPNPGIYGTNYINTTAEAFALCREVGSPGFRVNADLGTCVQNGESIDILRENIELVHHIHVSEPMLAPIERRAMHKELRALGYRGWVSIEMRYPGSLEPVLDSIRYVGEVLS